MKSDRCLSKWHSFTEKILQDSITALKWQQSKHLKEKENFLNLHDETLRFHRNTRILCPQNTNIGRKSSEWPTHSNNWHISAVHRKGKVDNSLQQKINRYNCNHGSFWCLSYNFKKNRTWACVFKRSKTSVSGRDAVLVYFLLLCRCSMAARKHYDHDNLQESLLRLTALEFFVTVNHYSKQQAWWQEQLRIHIFYCKQEAERMN